MKLKINLKEAELTKADVKHDERLLRRIQTLVDVVYGLVLFQLFLLLPMPTSEQIAERRVWEALTEHGPELMTVVVGVVWIILYWGQSNTQFGYLKRTNKTLSALSIIQLFTLMLYLYFIKLDNDTDGDVLALFMQSVFLAIGGFIGAFSWKYAAVNGMHFKELSEEKQYSIYHDFMPEPLAALVTIPFAFLGVGWYTLGWLSVIPLGILFKKMAKNKISSPSE